MGKCKALLVILTSFVFMNLNAQIKLTENGFEDVLLGRNIKETDNVVAFASFRDRMLFDVFPSESNFYVWESEQATLSDGGNIRYVFLGTDSNGLIIKISIWLEDPDHSLEPHLTGIFGLPKTKAETGVGGARGRDLTIWDTSAGVALFLAQPYNIDPVLKFQITKLDFYYKNRASELDKFIISTRFQNE